jgi:hypothetical protein
MNQHKSFIPSLPEDKALTVLRRKFLIGIPAFSACGYLGARLISQRFALSKWISRLSRIGGAIVTPIIGTMVIVHFNRGEIFRIGSSMMKELENARRDELGPFSDPLVRQKWDQQTEGKFGHLFLSNDQLFEDPDLKPNIDYQSIVNRDRF